MRIKRTNGIDGMYMGGVRQSQHYAKNSSLIKDPSTKNKYGFKLMTNEDRWMRIFSTCEMLNFFARDERNGKINGVRRPLFVLGVQGLLRLLEVNTKHPLWIDCNEQ